MGAMKAMKTLKATLKTKGKKDHEQDENQIAATRTAELKSMSAPDLKELVLKKGLEKGLKGEMVQSVLAQEAKEREVVRAQAAKRREVIATKKKEFESMTIPDLKELCETKSLKTGGSKQDKVERLVASAEQNGEIDKILANMARAVRRD